MRAELAKANSERDEYRKLAELLRAEVERLKLGLLGPKRERYVPDPNQLTLGILATALEQTTTSEAKHVDVPAHKRRASPTGRQIPDANLPQVQVEVLPEEVRREGLDNFERMGEEVSHVKERRAGGIVVVRTVRPKFVRKDRKKEEATSVMVAPPVELPLDRVSAGPGLLAETVLLRWQFHMPINRQEEWFSREGISLSKSTICEWHMRLAKLCDPLVGAMWKDAVAQALLMVDATGVLVQARQQCRKAHFWVVVSPRRHVLFRYTTRHTKEAVDGMLKGYPGYLVADAHTVYDHLFVGTGADKLATECGCWSHARRYFFKALESAPDKAMTGLLLIRPLFEREREWKLLTPDQRLGLRREHSAVATTKFFEWAEQESKQTLPETPLARAFGYVLNQKEALLQFLNDGSIPIHNNESERQLRREAVGRKMWLFVGSDDGAHANATFVTLLASCQLHGLDPWQYLRDLFILLPRWNPESLLDLSPFRWRDTITRSAVQSRLDANPFRRVTLGLPPR